MAYQRDDRSGGEGWRLNDGPLLWLTDGESGFKPTDQPHSPSAEHRRLNSRGQARPPPTAREQEPDGREYA